MTTPQVNPPTITKIALRIALVVAAGWAMWVPGIFALIVSNDPSVCVDLLAVITCATLALAGFRHVPLPLWFASYAVMVGLCVVGFVHHFRDYGESGPLPLEWLNNYFRFATPLLIVSPLVRLFLQRSQAGGCDGEQPRS